MNTKLGISTGVLAAAIFAVACFGGYVSVLLLVGYVFLFESDEWLKKAGVKALAVMLLADFICGVINVLPSVFNWINRLLGFFEKSVNFTPVTNFLGLFTSVVAIAETVFLLLLAYKALKNETVKVPFVDSFIDKHIK